MVASVYVSFDYEDQRHLQGFARLKQSLRHPLDFRDHAVVDADRNESGTPMVFPPGDPRSQSVRDAIVAKFAQCSKLVVLIGEETYRSEWVAWEIDTFFAMKRTTSGDRTWWRIRGMTLRGAMNAIIPQALNGQSTKAMSWDPEGLDQWLELDPDAQQPR